MICYFFSFRGFAFNDYNSFFLSGHIVLYFQCLDSGSDTCTRQSPHTTTGSQLYHTLVLFVREQKGLFLYFVFEIGEKNFRFCLSFDISKIIKSPQKYSHDVHQKSSSLPFHPVPEFVPENTEKVHNRRSGNTSITLDFLQ
jgi:hypothetical protein